MDGKKPLRATRKSSRATGSKATTVRPDPAARATGSVKKRSLKWRIFKWIFLFAIVLITLPVLLTAVYKPAFVHPVSTLMIYHWVQGKKVERQWVSFDDISPALYQSVLSSEDGQFCSHDGVDWNAVNLVVDDLMEGESPRGASTIPMQAMKNLYLWNSRSYIRKGLEVPLALLSDAIWGKRRMMEIYLNIAEWGPGIFGIEAAARHHFNRSAARLSRRQAALLAVTLPNPHLRSPARPSRGMLRLARIVEKRARASGAYVKCLR